MRSLISDQIESEMFLQANTLRHDLIELGGGNKGFSDIALTFDGISARPNYMSFAGGHNFIDPPADNQSKRLVLNGALKLIRPIGPSTRISLFSQNVALHQSVKHDLKPGTAVHLSVIEGGELLLRSSFGSKGKRWEVPSGI